MLRRSRVGTIPDLTRISAGVQRPGIDPRIWCSIAYALGESRVDPAYGHLVEVKLLPSEQNITCRVKQDYAGKSFGDHKGLIHKHDELVIVIPDGDPAHGGFVIARVWGSDDVPPDLVTGSPGDIVEVLEEDLNWYLKAQGTGKITAEAETVTLKSDKVRLGDEGATERVLLGTVFRSNQNLMHEGPAGLEIQFAALGAAIVLLQGSITAFTTAMIAASTGLLLPPAGVAVKAASIVFAASSLAATTAATNATTALTQAVVDFETTAKANQDYLSNAATVKE
jgi:hypothetical protein